MTNILDWLLPRNVIELFARLGRVFFVPYGTVRDRQVAAERACLEWLSKNVDETLTLPTRCRMDILFQWLSENVDETLTLPKAEWQSHVGGRVVYVYVGASSPLDPNFYRYTFLVNLPRFTFTKARVKMRNRVVFPPA